MSSRNQWRPSKQFFSPGLSDISAFLSLILLAIKPRDEYSTVSRPSQRSTEWLAGKVLLHICSSRLLFALYWVSPSRQKQQTIDRHCSAGFVKVFCQFLGVIDCFRDVLNYASTYVDLFTLWNRLIPINVCPSMDGHFRFVSDGLTI